MLPHIRKDLSRLELWSISAHYSRGYLNRKEAPGVGLEGSQPPPPPHPHSNVSKQCPFRRRADILR